MADFGSDKLFASRAQTASFASPSIGGALIQTFREFESTTSILFWLDRGTTRTLMIAESGFGDLGNGVPFYHGKTAHFRNVAKLSLKHASITVEEFLLVES